MVDRSRFEATTVPVFNAEECEHLINLGKAYGLKEGKAYSPYEDPPERVDHSYRVANSVILPHDEQTAWVEERCRWFIKQANKQFEFEISETYPLTMMFVEYPVGGFFSAHIDNLGNASPRKISGSIQLSAESDYEGGDLVVFEGRTADKAVMPKEQGCGTAFPSFVLHAVRHVTKGTRYCLVVWAFGDHFFK